LTKDDEEKIEEKKKHVEVAKPSIERKKLRS
jgi:hypothetical protein